MFDNPSENFISVLNHEPPDAAAYITGNAQNPDLTGTVLFYKTTYYGILIAAQIWNLPDESHFYGFHIHETGDCTLPFDKTGAHFNPLNAAHPFHAGDLPPLLGNYGYAWSVVYDERFSVTDIIGRSVVIHKQPDDFTTQPAGNSGIKIGCGVIRTYK